ncbi:MAG: phosphatase PAP2 family protein [Treponema sp.]|jgi:membrane-associated phospholipid phosphatase|nr:phosphatase PAP2 family protein [Treponema sp.]
MEEILQWGLDCIRQIQILTPLSVTPGLTMIMRAISGTGSAAIYMVLIPFVYWCVDEKKGLRLAVVLLISVWINFALKFFLDQPRPFFEGYDPSVGMVAETMGGFPSGHAQNSLVAWILIASWRIIPRLSRAVHFCIAAFLCLLIGFSRIYLGVHFPTDVLGGWLLGGIILAVYFAAGKQIEAWLESPRAGLIAAAVLAFAMNMYRPSEYMLIPGGMILGLGIGCFLCRRYMDFNASLKDRAGKEKYLVLLVRYALGITAMVLLYAATGKAVNGLRDSGNYQLYVFTRCILAAIWFSAGAPWVFCKLRLA